MTGRRDYIPLKGQLAAVLLTMLVEEDGKLVPFIDHETAKKLTPEQIISLFHRDHYPVRKEQGGPDAHWNLVFRPIMEHRHKTAKIDKPAIAKSDRLSAAQAETRRKMLAKAGADETDGDSPSRSPKRRWASRPMNYRKFDGTPVSTPPTT